MPTEYLPLKVVIVDFWFFVELLRKSRGHPESEQVSRIRGGKGSWEWSIMFEICFKRRTNQPTCRTTFFFIFNAAFIGFFFPWSWFQNEFLSQLQFAWMHALYIYICMYRHLCWSVATEWRALLGSHQAPLESTRLDSLALTAAEACPFSGIFCFWFSQFCQLDNWLDTIRCPCTYVDILNWLLIVFAIAK